MEGGKYWEAAVGGRAVVVGVDLVFPFSVSCGSIMEEWREPPTELPPVTELMGWEAWLVDWSGGRGKAF